VPIIRYYKLSINIGFRDASRNSAGGYNFLVFLQFWRLAVAVLENETSFFDIGLDLGSISQNSILAENFSDQLSSSNFGQISTRKQQT
jgi:hypothetical protein